MDGESISSVFSRTAREVFSYLDDMQYVEDPPKGVSETRTTGRDVMDGYAILHLESKLQDTSGLMLKVDGTVLQEQEAGFSRYDEVSKTIVVRPGPEVLEAMSRDGCRVSLLTDMKFLVRAVGEFYQRYGSMVRLPDPGSLRLEPVYPEGSEPTEEQRSAAEAILSSDMCYVWGAPGTGKTQFVLAAAIRSCMEAGERIAVFAPTNNSVEQVLDGVLKAMPEGEACGIIRLGVPTRDFYSRHPDMCEDRQVQRLLDREHESLSRLEEVRFERMCDYVRDDLEALIEAAPDMWEMGDIERRPDLAAAFESVSAVCSMFPETEDILHSDTDPEAVLRRIETALYDRPRPAAGISEYRDMSDSDLEARIAEARASIEELGRRATGDRIASARIIAATPHQFISRFRPKGSEDDGRMELDVDRVFLDEAGYCGLVLALPLFSNGVPVAMLGDHMQLPPVTELDQEQVIGWASGPGRLRDAFLWTMPALYCERALTSDEEGLRSDFLSGSPPSFALTARRDLTLTHRFGENLASVLDRYVYRNGLRGDPRSGMRMLCMDSVCDHRENRENAAEAIAVEEFLKSERPDPADVCILTPYSVQRALLRRTVPRRYRDCVMTVHGSQGREWDTVVLSVADNAIRSRTVPYRFTSSETPIGLRVINTAVSRAKRRLVIACDEGFWIERKGELLSGLLEECEREGRCAPRGLTAPPRP